MNRLGKHIVIFDIDGVLSEPGKRLIHIKKENPTPEDWDNFYTDCASDKPIGAGCVIAFSCYHCLNEVKFLTGRPEKCRESTLDWLHEYVHNCIKSEDLIMRENWNYIPDIAFKRKVGQDLGFKNILCVFEDKEKIVDMWAENGVTCYLNKHGVTKRSESSNE